LNAEVKDVRNDTRSEKDRIQRCQEDSAETTTLSESFRKKPMQMQGTFLKISNNNKTTVVLPSYNILRNHFHNSADLTTSRLKNFVQETAGQSMYK